MKTKSNTVIEDGQDVVAKSITTLYADIDWADIETIGKFSKINKSDWIEATLIGFNGYFKYRINALGNLEFIGEIIAPDPVVGEHFADLPEGYYNPLMIVVRDNYDITGVNNGHILVYNNGRLDLLEAPIAGHHYQFNGELIL